MNDGSTCPFCRQPTDRDDVECSLCGRELPTAVSVPAQATATTPGPAATSPTVPPQSRSWPGEFRAPAAPPPGAALPPGPPHRGTSPTVALLVGVLGAAVVLTGGLLFLRGTGSDSRSDTATAGPASTDHETASDTSAEQAPETSPEEEDSATQPPVSDYPEVSITGRECGRAASGPYAAAAAGNDRTSCPFALNVQQAYVTSNADGSSVDLEVFSPKTGKFYTMSCSGRQPVSCQGGDHALVFLYGGTAVFS